MSKLEQTINDTNEYVMLGKAAYDISFTEGRGCYLYDSEGKEYLDLLAGIAVCSLGHKNPAIMDAICSQSNKLLTASNYFYNEFKAPLAKALLQNTNLGKVFFTNSGAEANECAIKLVRKYFYNIGSPRYKIIALNGSFHGRTLATVTLTGQEKYSKPFGPLPKGLDCHIPINDIDALEKALSDKEAAAIILEVIQGESGINPLTKEYLQTARKLTKQNGQLLIIDEVQTGAGRLGTFWGFQGFDIDPDIVTSAKGIGGGFPIGACMATNEVASAFKAGDHGTTFGGSAFATRIALSVVNTIKEQNLAKKASDTGEYLMDRLRSLSNSFKEVRGKGLMVGAELKEEGKAKSTVKKMLEKGFILNVCGENTIRFVPPLIISKKQIDDMLDALKEVL